MNEELPVLPLLGVGDSPLRLSRGRKDPVQSALIWHRGLKRTCSDILLKLCESR